ncbi:general odorant-binding protein 83a-like [Leptinotarsa decemlineata]|uniref:general odorant-binding protein 83a-like n=1 Tax=Leptinotarsa decemlineata TaxID=7539 RepID=UPI003D30ABBE
MKLTLLVIIIGLSSSYAYLAEKDYGEKLLPLTKIWHDKCVAITGATQAQIDETKNGNFEGKENLKRYVVCVWILSDVLRPNSTIDVPLFKEMVPKKLAAQTQSYFDCTKGKNTSAETELHEKTWEWMKCIYNVSPEDFPMV